MKSIANQYRDLKEGKMSQQNFMRNLRMTMPQYVTNTTSFGDAVRILKNKSILSEAWDSPYDGGADDLAAMSKGEFRGFNHRAIEAAADDKISHTEQDDEGEPIYWSEKNPYVNYYIGSNDQIIKYDGKTGERYPIGNLGDYDQNKPDEFPFDYDDFPSKDDYDADYEEPRDDFDMAEGEDDEELSAMVKKMEDEKAGEEEVKSQYDLGEELNEAKKKEEKVEYSNHQCNPTELRLGIRTELEHGDMELDKAKEIAYKNIIKDPIYYTKLKLSGAEAHPKKVKGEKEVPAKKKKETIQLVDLVNQMQKVKMPKADDKKKLKEARFNVIGEPNEVAKQVMQFVDGNDTLKALSNDIEIQQTSDPNEALLRFEYWDALPSEAVEKLKLQFNVEKDSDSDEDTGEIIFYRLTPLRRNYGSKDLGASFEKFKSQLGEIIREVIAETFDGRDNLDAQNELNEAEDLQQYATKIATEHNLILMPQPLNSTQLYQMWKKEKGSFGSKEGVMVYDPSIKAVSVLSSDKKTGEAVMARFVADRGGTPSIDSKPFEEPGFKPAFFKQFLIAG